ncbi:hypothetical protein INR49_000999 [Caranx melampygus]|nr:hypothetical protein INR49_000999 [Caranx melampygus]
MIKINKGKRFQQAVDAVEDFLKKAKGKEQNSDGKGDSKGKKTPNKPLKILEEDDEDLSALKDPSEKDLTDSDPEPSIIERLGAGPGSGFKWESSPVKDDPHFHHFLLSQSEKPASSMEPISKRLKIIEEDTGSTSIQAADSTAINGSITPTDKRIGFLGLGLMGSGIVSNLLKMGHVVTVWNRTAEKCDLFIQEGARLGRTPAEVASMCDITFSCVSDPKAARDVVLGPSGVLQGIRPGKCYIEMSTAPVAGSQQLSNDGMLVILAAGDRTVYEDCSSCFQAMGKTSFSWVKQGMQQDDADPQHGAGQLHGHHCRGAYPSPGHWPVTADLLGHPLSGPDGKHLCGPEMQNILQGNFKPDYYLKHIQKDLRLAISMGDMANHPTPMAAAANDVPLVYKRAKALTSQTMIFLQSTEPTFTRKGCDLSSGPHSL